MSQDSDAGVKRELHLHSVVLTAKDRTRELHGALEAGADDYMVKPVDSWELKARILIGKRTLDLLLPLTIS